MDDRIQKALEFSNFRKTIEVQKSSIKARLETMLVLHYGNGRFKATPELIALINGFVANELDDAVVLDMKQIPVKITDLDEFILKLEATYHAATNEYFTEYTKLAKSRTINAAIGW